MFHNDTQLDLKMAITAWKTLWLETHASQERYDLVWQPTQELLDKLSANPPATLTCFAGDYYMFPDDSNGVAIDLFFIGENNVVYLATLFNKAANETDRNREIARLKLVNADLAQKLALTDSQAISRDRRFCKIPADTDDLDTEIATRAIKRYLAIWAPALLGCEIVWLFSEQAISLEQQIRTQAELSIQQQTEEERLQAVIEDESDLS